MASRGLRCLRRKALASRRTTLSTSVRLFSTTSPSQSSDSTTRFSSRVATYISSRPSSGTGILSRQILDEYKTSCPSLKVTGAEPNKDMRAAAEEILAQDVKSERFISNMAQLEPQIYQMPLSTSSSPHKHSTGSTFPKARAEALRILKNNGKSGAA